MSIADALIVLQNFFFGEVSQLGVGAMRICLGLVVFIDLITLASQRHVWYSPGGVLPYKWWRIIIRDRFFSLFHVLPPTHASTNWVLAAAMVAALCVMLGVALPYSTLALFVLVTSVHHRNFHILYGGDGVIRLMLFLLCFAPVDGLSVHHFLTHGRWEPDAPGAAWPLRLMQLQLCIIYWYALVHKTNKKAWQEGTALYFPLNNLAFRYLPLPDICRTATFSRLATPAVVLIEALLPIAAWFSETRLIAVALGVAFHVALGWSLSIHMFGPIMIACWLVFLSPTTSIVSDQVAAVGPGPVAMVVAFILFALFWDDPHKGYVHYWLQRRGRRFVQSLGLHHSWPLFAGDPPARSWAWVEVVAHVRGVTIALNWRFGQLLEPGQQPRLPRFQHRFRKFEEALSRGNRLLKHVLLEQVTEEITRRYGEPDAVAIFKHYRASALPGSTQTDLDVRATLLVSKGIPSGQETEWWCYPWNLARAGQSLPELAEMAFVAAVELCCSGQDPTPALARLKWIADRAPLALSPESRGALLDLVRERVPEPHRRRYIALVKALTLGEADERQIEWWRSIEAIPPWLPWTHDAAATLPEGAFHVSR